MAASKNSLLNELLTSFPHGNIDGKRWEECVDKINSLLNDFDYINYFGKDEICEEMWKEIVLEIIKDILEFSEEESIDSYSYFHMKHLIDYVYDYIIERDCFEEEYEEENLVFNSVP